MARSCRKVSRGRMLERRETVLAGLKRQKKERQLGLSWHREPERARRGGRENARSCWRPVASYRPQTSWQDPACPAADVHPPYIAGALYVRPTAPPGARPWQSWRRLAPPSAHGCVLVKHPTGCSGVTPPIPGHHGQQARHIAKKLGPRWHCASKDGSSPGCGQSNRLPVTRTPTRR